MVTMVTDLTRIYALVLNGMTLNEKNVVSLSYDKKPIILLLHIVISTMTWYIINLMPYHH